MNPSSLHVRGVELVSLLTLMAALSPHSIGAQGQYQPVTAADVVGLKLNHYFSSDKKHHAPDFAWNFDARGFTLKKGPGAIPEDLVGKLLPAGINADEIRGKWSIKDSRLVLTEIMAGDVAGRKEVSLSLYRTAPTVVRIGEPQYVFAVDR